MEIADYIFDRYQNHKWVPIEYLFLELHCTDREEEILKRCYMPYILVHTMAAAVWNVLEHGYSELSGVADMIDRESERVGGGSGNKYVYLVDDNEYESLKELAAAMGVGESKAFYHFTKHGKINNKTVTRKLYVCRRN